MEALCYYSNECNFNCVERGN